MSTIPSIAPPPPPAYNAADVSVPKGQVPTELAGAKAVASLRSSTQSNGNLTSSSDSDQGRESAEQDAAVRVPRPTRSPGTATSDSVVTAQVASQAANTKQPPLPLPVNPFEKVALPDPLPTAPILKHLAENDS